MSIVDWIRTCLAVFLLLVFVVLMIGHLTLAIIWIVAHRKVESFVPLVGGLSGTAGIFLLPFSCAHWYWWAPLVLDLGTGWMVIGGIYMWIRTRKPRD